MTTRLQKNVKQYFKDNIGIIGALLILCIFLSVFPKTSGSFLTQKNIFNVLRQISSNLFLACGMTMVIILGGIDLSVGSIIALSGCFAAGCVSRYGLPIAVGVLGGVLVGTVVGMFNGVVISRTTIPPFIVTLAGMFFARGMTSIISQEMISITNKTFTGIATFKMYLPFGGYLNKKGVMIYPYVYPSVIIALVVLAIVFVVLKYTKFGRSIYAIGGNEQSALLLGLNVRRIKLQAYVLDGFLAGLGGLLFCMNTCSGFVEQAKGFEMDAIASSVIGGTLLTGGVGNVIGSLFGVLIKGTIESFITFQGTLSSWWVRITIAALLCFFIVLQSLIAALKRKNK